MVPSSRVVLADLGHCDIRVHRMRLYIKATCIVLGYGAIVLLVAGLLIGVTILNPQILPFVLIGGFLLVLLIWAVDLVADDLRRKERDKK